MKKPELLSPAGSLETALAAFDGGADAVYCGLSKFNARERAVNFSFPELRTLLERAHTTGKKVYVTFNTLIRNDELDEVAAFLTELAKTPPDALIVQDPGVIQLVNKYFPFFTLHASTQMGIHNSCGVETLEKLNIKRVILERQITLDELKTIRRKSRLELEVFIHGSLCCSLSGRCLFSSFLNGTSGNRGRCKQPCRRCYAAEDNSKQDFFLSPYDLDGSTLVEELSRIGIDSFKIEGRLRGSDYICKTARAYRLLIDHPNEPEAVSEAKKLLESAAMRQTSSGFYFHDNFKNIINFRKSGVFGIEAGTVEQNRNGYLTLKTAARLHLGDRIRAVGDKDDVTFSLTKLQENRTPVIRCRAGSTVVVGVAPQVKAGSKLFKIGENGFDYRSLEKSLRPGRYPASLEIKASASNWSIKFSHLPGFVWQNKTDFAPAEKRPVSKDEIAEIFSAAPVEPWRIDRVTVDIEGSFFAPGSVLKSMRRDFWNAVKEELPPPQEYFKDLENNLQTYLNRENNIQTSPEVELPQDIFTIPAFIPETALAEVQSDLQKYFASGKRDVAATGFHAFALLKNAPQDTKIFVKFPLPVTNIHAAELIRELGAYAFEPEIELDEDAYRNLLNSIDMPHIEDSSPLPVLVTRAAIDKTLRNDGIGNTLLVKDAPREKCRYLFIADCDVRKKFKKGKLL